MEIDHPLLNPGSIAFRGYQANLARIAAKENTLVVLPTGLGKTVIMLLCLLEALEAGKDRILVMAPTKPLVDQHGRFLAASLAEPWRERVQVLTGSTPPKKRVAEYGKPGFIVATPQIIQNDMLAGRVDVRTFDWIVYDEAHRAIGDYPYTFIGEHAQTHTRAIGLTASPGHELAKIQKIQATLGLHHVEIRTITDQDVQPYVQEVDVQWETLPLPPAMERVSQRIEEVLAARVRSLRELGLLKGSKRPNRMDLLDLSKSLQSKIQRSRDPDSSLYQGLSLQAQCMKLLHGLEQAQTQGSEAFIAFFDRLKAESSGPKPSKASINLANEKLLQEASQIAKFATEENPKLGRVEALVGDTLRANPQARIIVFAHYRGTCETIQNKLQGIANVKPVVFVGQSKRGGSDGLTQKQQVEILQNFRQGETNVLVATSVAEEGLDIPQTDCVVFYEPIPSEIRSIQRRGRTGRNHGGKVVVLMTKGTQDEAAHWTARRKEQQMVQELTRLRSRLTAGLETSIPKQSTLAKIEPPKPGFKIIHDHREQGSVVKELHAMGVDLEPRQLDIGDFVLSDRVVVERKSCKDFVDSLVDGRLFEQMKNLHAYPKPYVIIEGESLLGHRNVNPDALLGAVASITVDHGIPVLQTKDGLETARFLHAVARREQKQGKRRLAVRQGKPNMTLQARQLHLISGLPGISETIASRLLDQFGSVAAVFAASQAELREVESIGNQLAAEIRRVLDIDVRTETVS